LVENVQLGRCAATPSDPTRRSQDLLEGAAVAILGLDGERRITFANPQAAGLFGFRPAQLIGVSLEALLPGADFRFRPAGSREFAGVRNDGSEIVVELTLTPIANPDRDAFVATIADVTARKLGCDDVAQLNAELLHRCAEMEAFSYSVAHDLKAPLRAVSGFAKALEEDHGDALDADAKRFIGLIVAGSIQMNKLIDALLALGRLSSHEMVRTSIDLSDMARSTIADLQEAEPGRNAMVTIAPGMTASGDRTLLTVALQNLLANAWKFTRDSEPGLIYFYNRNFDGETVYSVSDNGVGFEKKHSEEVFSPFKRLHGNKFEGTGVGLATVARIVRRHGGRVWATPEPGAGATFSFTLGEGERWGSSLTG
jgi:PAS domain S-box-containing protein